MKGMRITRDDSKQFLRAIQSMADKRVLVGIPDDKSGRDDGMSNSVLGAIHENGSPANNIPPRPFLVPGVREVEEKCAATLRKYAENALAGNGTIDQGLHAVGLIAQTAVKNRIRNQVGFKPLEDSTTAARKRDNKKGTKALIRTGQLLKSITYVVRQK